ncbi:MAG: GNAT family N-acetyltransferase [Actinomycetota bacterium]|nr:GNAT family N-acetyltransferase [Actinomycetota bacterium]
MDVDIRVIRPEELPAFRTALGAAFGDDEMREEWDPVWENVFENDRLFVAMDEDLVSGTAGNFSFTMTVPGGELPTAGLTVVGVPPTHRRKGIARKLMRFQIEDARKRKEPLSILWASEDAIYQRFGYGLGVSQMRIESERGHTDFRLAAEPAGRARLLTREEAAKVLPDVYERVRIGTPGMLARSPEWWQYHRLFDPKEDRDGAGKMMVVVWEDEGRAEAYALYRFKEKWAFDTGVSSSEVLVFESLATSVPATQQLWNYLFGIDLAQKVIGYFLPVDHPLPLMVLEPRRLKMGINDSIWLRAVDVQEALANRSYALQETLTFALSDPFCEWNDGIWKLSAPSGGHSVDRFDGDPELALDSCDLGAIYLGGTTVTELHRAGRIQELKPGAIAKADAMFRTDRKPWCPEIF